MNRQEFHPHDQGLRSTAQQTTPPIYMRRDEIRNCWLLRLVLFMTVLAMSVVFSDSAHAQTFGCTPAMANDIVCENSKAGNDPSQWSISGVGDTTIQGFATDISVNQGSTASFKINTNAKAYSITIFRLGYYGGNGARKITTFSPSATLPQTQPACLNNTATNLHDCGNWAVSASWQVPSNATSGVYIALLTRADTGGVSQIVFIVRNDASTSDILYQTSDETWQAYNFYGGNSLYGADGTFDLTNRAFKVSYNRPFFTRAFSQEAATFVFGAEFAMIQWLEQNGYDVTYFTGVDAARNGSLILNHKAYVTAGHDEYWSGPHRTNVEAARDAGVNMAFFTGNEVFWKTRWENSTDGSNTPFRTLVCYKETLDSAKTDPADPPTWTGTWRDPRFSPPADGGRPENSLNGTIFMVNGTGTDNNGTLAIHVPAADGKMRFWRKTAAASLASSQTYTLPSQTLGYEWDEDLDNGARPAGAFQLSTTTQTLTADLLLDYGGTYGGGTATHHLMMYRTPSGALVFGAGTVDWAFGLNSNHDDPFGTPPNPDSNMQQATVNLFADMGVQPGSLQSGLLFASKSADTVAPSSVITSPNSGSTFQFGTSVTITGTAADSGGGVVGGVEVSVDGGQTWHPATGRESWSYTWTISASGSINLKSRAVDDSGNLETSSPGITVNVPKPPISSDAQVSTIGAAASTTVKSPTLSTSGVNELLLAFIATDYLTGANTTVTSVTGGGLTWALVVRANGQSGTSEIWRAFSPVPLSNVSVTATLSQSVLSSVTVMSFTGVDSSGANGSGAIGAVKNASAKSGAPTATLITTRANSWVLGVGNDFDNAIFRTPATGQSLINQYLTPSGDTYWVQMQNSVVALSGTSVSINDTAPTGDQYNLAICEVLAGSQTWSLSGTISPSSTSGGTVLTLTGSASASLTADASGNYTFAGLANGTYTVTPSKPGYSFTPASQTVPINGSNAMAVNFTATALPTFAVSGAITPINNGSNATVTLTSTGGGGTNATATADPSGNYTFPTVLSGTYTATPTKTGFTFLPVSQSVTVSNGPVSSVNFTATPVPTYSISGSVSGAVLSGVTMSLSGASTGSATTDASGNYSFTGLSNGNYTVTPSKTGYTFTPTSQPATVSNGNVTSISFTAQAVTQSATLAVDASVSILGSKSTSVVSPAFSTTSTNELLLAFIATDYISGANTSVTGVTGGGLTWVLVVRANAQSGSSEVWRAFAPTTLTGVTVTASLSQSVVSSLTVLSFIGVDTTGASGSGAIGATKPASAASGAPTATLVTTRNSSWVLGVGNDFDNAIGRVAGANQTVLQQYLTSAGDTYWVQKQNATTPLSGTSVTINDTAPTGDRYNLAIIEVLPAAAAPPPTYSISGIVSGAIAAGVTVNLTGASTGTATTDTGGNYSFSGLASGTYTVTPSKSGYSFTPTNVPVTVSSANVPGQNFTSVVVPTYSISGSVSGAIASGVTMNLSGASTATTITDASGNFTFTGLASGNFTVIASKVGYTFTPASQEVPISGANVSSVTFTSTLAPTWSISGTIAPTSLSSGAIVTLSGALSATATVDSSGNYTFGNLLSGTYTVTPAASGVAFTPASQSLSLNVGNASGVNFTAQAAVGTGALAIDANVSTNGAKATTVASPIFSTKSGNELLLAFVATDYLTGANTTVAAVSGGGLTWALAARANGQSGTSEIWRAFAATPLSNVTVTATISQSVISSITVVTFTGADTTGVSGSGAIGATKTASLASGAPTASVTTSRNNSWVFGVGNDFDNAIARTPGTNQTLVHQLLTSTGDTYWVQMQNAVTPSSGTSVSINDTAPTTDRFNLAIVEVLPGTVSNGTPPTVVMTSPTTSDTVATLATVSANASDAKYALTGVQFLLDGSNLGSKVTSTPYSMTWDSSTTSAGTHALSAIAYNSAGVSATASPVSITVDHSGNAAVVGSWSSVLSLPTVAMNLILMKNGKLMFYEDGGSATVWDYTNNVFTSVPTSVNLFCSGHASLADGRILVMGGYGGSSNLIGIANAEIFDPSNNSWSAVPSMSYRRWYPTGTTLSDGRVLVTAGWQTTNHTNAGIPEIYDPSTNQWTKLANANNPFETYPFMFPLQDGRIIHVGGTEFATNTDILNLSTQSWSVVDSRIIDGGAAAMYLPGQIMKAGSAADSQAIGASANTTFLLDTTQPSPTWRQTPSMAYPRSFLNLTELPDGSVLATGGETDKNGGNIANAVYAAELWSPQTQTWTTMSSMKTPREYHSTALLLPDARVIVSGMGFDFGQVPDETNAEIFSPPYLFKGARPVISQAPAQVQYNTAFSVTTPDFASISRVVLIRTGATTHFFDQNTRYVPLTFQQASGGLTVTAPVDGNSASPGYYMLFLVNNNGVPSVAQILQVHP
jgi:hypothetical protein